MKKTMVASIIAMILLMTSFTAAADQIPLADDEKNELENLVEEIEDEDLREELNDILDAIIVENNIDTEAVEDLLNEYYAGNKDFDFTNTDSWEWILDRLGYIYIAIDYFTNIYNTGMLLYNQILYKINLARSLIQNLNALKAAWQAFKEQPIVNAAGLISALQATAGIIVTIVQDLTDGETEVINAFNQLKTLINDFKAWLDGTPWAQPIHIYGEVTGTTESVTVSCGKDTTTTTGHFDLYFTTSDEEKPYLPHKCTITASLNEQVLSEEKYAFSDGSIEVNFSFSGNGDNKPSDQSLNNLRHINIFERLSSLLSVIRENIVNSLIYYLLNDILSNSN